MSNNEGNEVGMATTQRKTDPMAGIVASGLGIEFLTETAGLDPDDRQEALYRRWFEFAGRLVALEDKIEYLGRQQEQALIRTEKVLERYDKEAWQSRSDAWEDWMELRRRARMNAYRSVHNWLEALERHANAELRSRDT